MKGDNFYIVLEGEAEVWADKLSALDSVSNSSSEDFDTIYDRFIQRRGKDGYLGKKCA